MNGFPDYASVIERWREIGSKGNQHTLIDMRTFDDSHADSANVWIKQTETQSDTDDPYSVQQYEMNCGTQQIR